jgi:hypothetical protein
MRHRAEILEPAVIGAVAACRDRGHGMSQRIEPVHPGRRIGQHAGQTEHQVDIEQ